MRGTLLAATILVAASAFPQTTTAKDSTRATSSSHAEIGSGNSIAYLFVVDNYFDGNRPFIQSLRSPTMGAEYRRKLSRKWSLHLSARYCFRSFMSPPDSRPLQVGDIIHRIIFFADLSVHRTLFTWNSGALKAFAGLSLRIGGEHMYVGQFSFHPLIDKYYLLDPGIICGFRADQALFWRLGVSLEAKYGYYIWTDPHPYLYAFDLPNRPTRNLLALQLGINFNF